MLEGMNNRGNIILSHSEQNKNTQPFQKTYGIHCNFISLITPMENFTTFYVENPVCEITTHIFRMNALIFCLSILYR